MKPIYLEPDEEITSVVDKLKALSDHKVAIVVPKNGTLFQSLINLKLLAKEAKNQGKEVVIVSTNRVGQRLAQQVGFTTYNTLGTIASEPEPTKKVAPAAPSPSPETIIDGVKVNQYNPDVPVAAAVEAAAIEGEAIAEPTAAIASDEATDTESAPTTDEVVAEEVAVAAVPAAVPMPVPKLAASQNEAAPLKPESKPSETDQPPPAASSPVGGGELPPIVPRSIHVAAPKEPFKMPWRSVAIGAAITLALLAVVYFFLPKAVVTLTLPATAVNPTQDINVTTKSPDGEDNTIAGNLLTTTQTGKATITATGQKDIGTKASGDVTFYNKASSASVTLASGTSLTASGKTFTLDKAITIPGASVSGGSVVPGQTTGSITASEVGDSSNLKNAQFAIAKQPELVYATGTTAGGVTKTVTVLSQEDIDKAVTDLRTELTNKAVDEIKKKATKQAVLDNSGWLEVTSQTVDQPVDAQVESATLAMGVEAGEIAFDERAAKNAIKAVANKDVQEGQELIVPDDKSITLTYKSVSEDKSVMVVTASLNGYIVAKINKLAVSKALAHQSKAKAVTLVKAKYQATDVSVALRPSWWPGQLPFFSSAIEIKYGFQEATPPATTK